MTVAIAGERILLTGPGGAAVILRPLQAGRLRAVLRDVLLDLDRAGQREVR